MRCILIYNLCGTGAVNGPAPKIPENRECFCLNPSPGISSEPGIGLAQVTCLYLNQSLWPGRGERRGVVLIGEAWSQSIQGMLSGG